MKRIALFALALTLTAGAARAQQELPPGETNESCQTRSMAHCHAQCNPAQNACLATNPNRIDLCHNQYEWCYGVCMDTTWCGYAAF